MLTDKEIGTLLTKPAAIYRTAFMLGLYAGLRAGEACHLRWQDIDLPSRTLKIRAQDGWRPKNKPSVRDIPLHPKLAAYLRSWRALARSEWVVAFEDGRRLDEAVLCAMIAKMRRKYAIEGLCYHVLRHTFVSKLAEGGADLYAISKLIGHSNTKITENTYTHLKDRYYFKNISKLKITA